MQPNQPQQPSEPSLQPQILQPTEPQPPINASGNRKKPYIIIALIVVICVLAVVGFIVLHKVSQNDTKKAGAATNKTVTLKTPLGTVTTQSMNTSGFSSDDGSIISVDFGVPTLSASATNIGGVAQKAELAWLKIPITVTLVSGTDPAFVPSNFLELRDASGYRLRPSASLDDTDDTELAPGQSIKENVSFNISQPSNSFTIGIVEPYSGILKGETKSFTLPLADFGKATQPDFTAQAVLPAGSVLGDLSGDVSGTTLGKHSVQHFKIELGKPNATAGDEGVDPAPKGSWLAVPYNVTYVSSSGQQDVVGAFTAAENFELRDAKGHRVLPDVLRTTDSTLAQPGDTAQGTLYFDADSNFGPFTIAFIGFGVDEGKTINETKPFSIP